MVLQTRIVAETIASTLAYFPLYDILSILWHYAPVAQLDRVPGYELGGREFESLRARHSR